MAAESRFYDVDMGEETLTLEPQLSKLEGNAKLLFKRILDANTVSVLDEKERTDLSFFFGIQMIRTRSFREQWRFLPVLLRQHLDRWGEDAEGLREYTRVPIENETAAQTIRFMLENAERFARHFTNKAWILLSTGLHQPFLIGDNPITLQNTVNQNPYRGTIGLAVPGIEIYFPLSPTRALAMWCRSHEIMFRELARLRKGDAAFVQETVTALDTGRPLNYRPENTMNFNSLQVLYAERFVFSNVNEFALVREMIASDASVRSGPRVQSN